MATASIIHTQGTVSQAQEITCYGGETLTVTVTMKTTAGAARDCSGGSVALAFGRRGDSRSPLTASATGTANGVHTITIDRDTTHKLDKRYEYTVVYTDANGEVEACCGIGGLVIPDMVGGVGYDIAGTLSTAPVVQMTSPTSGSSVRTGEVTWTFIASSSSALTASNFLAVIGGEPTSDTVTLTSGSGTTNVVGSITATLTAGSKALSVRCTVGTSQTTATARTVSVYPAPSIIITTPGAWVLAGTVNVLFAAASTDVGESFTAGDFSIVVDGEAVPGSTATIDGGSGTGTVTGSFSVSLLGVTAHTVEVVCTDQHGGTTTSPTKTVNTHTAPTAVMGTPAVPSPNPGTSAFTFTATDDAVLTAANCVAVVDGADTADTITFSGTSGSFSTSLSTTGAHTVAVRVTDAHSVATTSASVTVTVAQPELSLITPSAAMVKGTSALTASGSCSPAMPDGTEVRLYDAVDGGASSQVGTTTLSGGLWSCSTGALAIGQHSLTAKLTTLAGVVTSAAKAFETYPQPSVAVTLADGAWVVSGSVSVPFSASTTDGSESFTAGDFALIVDGAAIVSTATIATGSGSATVTGSFTIALSDSSAHALAVSCIDRHAGATTSATKTINLHLAPVVTMVPPGNLTPLPGVSSVTFGAIDDANMTAGNCTAIVDGSPTLDLVTLTSGSGSQQIQGGFSTTLSTAGAHTIAVKVTDAHGVATTGAPVSVTVTQPTLVLDSPTTGATYDLAQAVSLHATCSPSLPNGTTITFLDGVTTVGTASMLNGAGGISLAPEIGPHTYTAAVTTIAGTVASSGSTVTITDYLPVISDVSPATGGTVSAGTLAVSATITHEKSRPMLARFRVDSGAWVAMTFVGSVATGTSTDSYVAEVSRTLTIQATDAADWTDAAAITTSTTTFAVTYATAWNGGVLSMSAAAASTTTPSSGALLIDLSGIDATAVDGAKLKITVPTGPTALGLLLPTGYTQTSSAALAWVDASTLDGWTGWRPGCGYTLLVSVNKITKVITVSDRIDLSVSLPTTTRLFRLTGATADVVGRTPDGSPAGDSAVVTSTAQAADPLTATRLTTHGTVCGENGTGGVLLPVAGGVASFTIAGWLKMSAGANIQLSLPGGSRSVPIVSICMAGTSIYFADGNSPGSVAVSTIDPNGHPNPASKWCHCALVSKGATFDLWWNGRKVLADVANSKNTSTTWTGVATVGNSPGFGGFGGTWSASDSYYANMMACPAQLTADQIGAHMTATAPLATTSPFAVCNGSSIQVTVDTGDGLAEAARVITGIATTHYKIQATHGRAVESAVLDDMTLNKQSMIANLDYSCRGCVCTVDYGNVHNQAGAVMTLAAVQAADVLFRKQIDYLLRAGWRIIVIDWGESTTWGGVSGTYLRQVQEDFFRSYGASVIRFRTREFLGSNWQDVANYTDDGGSFIHLNSVGVNKLAEPLAALVVALLWQTVPKAKPAWV